MTEVNGRMDECQQEIRDITEKYKQQIENELKPFADKAINDEIRGAIGKAIEPIFHEITSKYPESEFIVINNDGKLRLRWLWNIGRNIVWSGGAGCQPQEIRPRSEVIWFSEQMELKLAKNDHRPGWKDATYEYLLELMREHADKLERSILNGNHAQVILDAADVANFAMMIADISNIEVRKNDAS